MACRRPGLADLLLADLSSAQLSITNRFPKQITKAMIGQSDRVRKMTEYHRFADKIDQAYEGLSAKTKSFMTHVEACLPSGREKWWRVRSESGGEPEVMRDELREDLMFEVSPYSEALRCARRLDEPWKGGPRNGEPQNGGLRKTARAERSIKSSSSRLKFRAGQILKRRERYFGLLLEEDRIRRKGAWDWYETVRNVRNVARESDLCPLVQINQLQATFQESVQVEAGFPEVEAGSLGEAAIKGLGVPNRRLGGPHRSTEKHWEDLPLRGTEIEDAVWALYFSIASGDRAPGEPVRGSGSKWAGPYDGTCILRN